jgi:transposase
VGQKALAAVEKRARRQNALILFEDESGVSLLPSVRATWAPRGQTPVLRHHFAWKRLSIAGVLAYESDGSDAHLVFQLRPGAYNDDTLIEFLAEVHQHERQRTAILIWDGLPSHRSRRMLDWVADQRDWLSIEPLPGYAPDLNPIEQAWGNVKSQELANFCADTIAEVSDAATDCTASAATPHSASPSSVTPACDYDPPQPAIARSSLGGLLVVQRPSLLAFRVGLHVAAQARQQK